MTLDQAEKAIAIFRKYEKPEGDRIDFLYSAEHDEVWGGPDSTTVSAEDKAALEELGWHDYDDGGFHHFV